MKRLIVSVTIAVLLIVGVRADQPLAWPRFRGPGGSGVADGQNPPVEFGPDKNVKWKVTVPSGLSSPIVAGDKLVITAFDGGKLYTIAYRRADGKEAWRAQAPAKQIEGYHKTEGSPAASTPATDGERIVSYFGSCGLFCYDLSGKQIWKYEMPPAGTAGDFGTGVSPILAEGTVVLVRDTIKDSKIVALDAVNGSIKWQKKRQSPVSYSTPVVWDTPAGKQVVAAGHARMIGYDLKTGAEKWFVASLPSGCCSSPVAADGILYFAGWSPGGPDDNEFRMPTFDALLKDLDKNKDGALSRAEAEKAFEGFFDNQDNNKDGRITRDEWDLVLKFMSEGKNSAFALRAGGSGDATTSHVLWKKTRGLPYIASALLYRGQYVMVRDGGIVTALDAQTGNEVYQERIAAPGRYYSSPVAANGNIYFISLEEGVVTVLKAVSDKPVVVASAKLGERVAATPAIADNTLYVRTDKHLYAFAEGSLSSAQPPQSKPAPAVSKLYTDDEIRKLAKHDIDKESAGDRGIFGVPCLDVVPAGESHPRAKVFKKLNIDDARLQDFRHCQRNFVVFLTWQVSPSYDICCMSVTNYDGENDGLELIDPQRKVYGIRLLKRAKVSK